MQFFSLDSSFHKYGTILFDLIVLNLLWFFLSGTFMIIPALISGDYSLVFLPLLIIAFLTPGATAGVMNAVKHVLIDEDGYLMASFFTVYRRKFKRMLGVSAASMLVFAISFFNIWSVTYGPLDLGMLTGLYLFVLLEYVMIMVYCSALLAETDMTVKLLLKYGFLLANKHIFISVLIFIPIVATYFLLFQAGNLLILLLAPAPGIWFITWLLHSRVLDKYYLDKLV